MTTTENHSPAATIKQISQELREYNTALIRRVVLELGEDVARQVLQEALEVEKQGGMQVLDGSRKRTPGGAFFRLVRKRCTPEQQRHIFGWAATTEQLAAQPKAPAQPAAPQPTWRECLSEVLKLQGEATTMKITVIGRPRKVMIRDGCAVLTMKAEGKVPSLPKGVPAPANFDTLYICFVSAKQWAKVQGCMDDEEDALIIEGAPQINLAQKCINVYASSCTTKKIQMARKQPKEAGA